MATVFSCKGSGKCNRSGITYNTGLSRYIVWMSDWNGTDDFRNPGTGGLGIYESSTPWIENSWKMVWHTPTNNGGWGVFTNDGIGDAGVFTTKWMSSDGKEMYLAYGGNNKYSLRKATFTVNGSITPTTTPTVQVGNCPKKSQGDADCNGKIDLSDFEQFRKEYTASSTSKTADFDGSGSIGLADFEIWRRNYYIPATITPTIIVLSATPTISGIPQPSVAPGGYTVKSNKIYNVNNQPHIFRGIDRPSLEWNAMGEHLSLADYQEMRKWNANVVRVAVNQKFWRDDTSGYRARLDENINWIKSTGMDVIIDLHWSDGASQTDGAGQHRMADLYSIEFWKQIAEKYKNDGRVLFELYNEPHDISCEVWKNGGDSGEGYQASGMQQIYDAIRQQSAHNLVLIGGLNWAFDLTCVKTHRITGYNIAYATHPYNFEGKNTEADWDSKVGFIAPTDPVIITEFGDTQNKESSGDVCTQNSLFTKRIIDWAESNHFSWTAWAWFAGSCEFPSLLKDWNGWQPNATGQVVKNALISN